jgi:hypothetical protein
MPLWVGALLAMAGCVDDPRPLRRAGAIDVAGTWQEVRDSGSEASLVIINESDINDLVATLRGRTVDDAETAALARVPSPPLRDGLVAALELGAGPDAVREETDGGENVSFDGGETTTLQVRSAPVPIAASSPEARNATLAWSLRLDGDATALAGSLAVLVSEQVPRVGDVNGFARTTTRIDLPLRFVREEE